MICRTLSLHVVCDLLTQVSAREEYLVKDASRATFRSRREFVGYIPMDYPFVKCLCQMLCAPNGEIKYLKETGLEIKNTKRLLLEKKICRTYRIFHRRDGESTFSTSCRLSVTIPFSGTPYFKL